MKVAITSATKDQLNYAIAVSQGVKVVPPEFASYEAVKDWELPFTLWEVNSQVNSPPDGKYKYTVSPIKVTRCGYRGDKTTLRSIDFTDSNKVKCVGSIELFHLTEQSALHEVSCLENGVFDKDEHTYTDDWNLCGQLVDKFPYVCSHAVNRASILSCDVKEEIVRSVLTLLCGQEIEVPDDKSNL